LLKAMDKAVVNLVTSLLDCLSLVTKNPARFRRIFTPNWALLSTILIKSFRLISKRMQSVLAMTEEERLS